MSVIEMHIPASTGITSVGSSGSCGSLIMNGEAGGEYPEAGAASVGNIPEVVATIIVGVAGTGNGVPDTTGNVCLWFGETLQKIKLTI